MEPNDLDGYVCLSGVAIHEDPPHIQEFLERLVAEGGNPDDFLTAKDGWIYDPSVELPIKKPNGPIVIWGQKTLENCNGKEAFDKEAVAACTERLTSGSQ